MVNFCALKTVVFHAAFMVMALACYSIKARTCSSLDFVKEFHSRRSKIVRLSRSDGSPILLKQRLGHPLHKHLMSALEVLGTSIAASIDVACNHVELVPADKCPRYKLFKDRPATLHSLVPGAPLDEESRPRFKVKQSYRHTADKKRGLTLDIIRDMAKHPQLPKLVALDTFIGNIDRHRGNIIYDGDKDKLYAIDFGDIMKVNLCRIAIKNIKAIRNKKYSLKKRERAALLEYRNTLEQLSQLHKPFRLYRSLVRLIRQAGILGSSAYRPRSDELHELLSRHRRFIFKSHQCVKKLIAVLDDFLADSKRK